MQNRSCWLLLSGDLEGWESKYVEIYTTFTEWVPPDRWLSYFCHALLSCFPASSFAGERKGNFEESCRCWTGGKQVGERSRCRGFAAREAFFKPFGEHSQSSPGLHVETVSIPGQRLQNAGDTLFIMQTGCAKLREIRTSHECQRPERFNWKRQQLM